MGQLVLLESDKICPADILVIESAVHEVKVDRSPLGINECVTKSPCNITFGIDVLIYDQYPPTFHRRVTYTST